MIVDLNFVDEPSKKKLFALLRRMIEMSVTNPDQPLEKEEKKKEEEKASSGDLQKAMDKLQELQEELERLKKNSKE